MFICQRMISLEKKFLFIHIFKTGGNSVQSILHPYALDQINADGEGLDGVERFKLKNERYEVRKHSRLTEYKSVLEPDVYEGLFKFSTIRNPWDRMISFYFSPHRGVTEWNRQDFIELVQNDFTLRDFIALPEESGLLGKIGIKKRQKPVDAEIDFILRFEHLNADFSELCDRLDIPKQTIPHRNKSSRDHYSKYYDEELVEIVREKHAEEIALGNYTFS